jgi:putative flippase GtrA
MTTSLKLQHRLFFYLGIGGTAAVVNISIVLLLVSLMQLQPLVANVFAFLIAFNISYFGHKYFTFSRLHNEKKLSLPHFFLVAISGAAINESLYYLFLKYTTLNYLISLVIVLGLVATYSFILSRFWACR